MALQYVEAQRQARPDLAEWYASLEDLYQRKLWHQLTLKLDQFLQLQAAQTGDTIIQLYNNFITDFETKINLLKLAHFAVIASRQYPDKDAAITFLEGVITKLRETRESRINEPILYVKMQIAAINLEKGNQKECKNLLEEGKTTLDSMTDVDPTVHASFYWISSQYHKARQEFAEFYKKALLYLAYTTVESLSESFKLDLAFDLSLAALLGDNIYNFGELLAHPIINSLIGTKGEWVYRMLQAFNTGNLALYQELCRVHSAALLCLMEIIFSRPSEDRTIPLSVIAERTKLSVSDVENLLMKSLSVHLIEGIVDEVDSTVHVSSVQPRVLGIPKVKGSREIQKPIQLRPDKNIQACPQTLDRTDSHPRNIFSFAIHPPPPPPMDSKRRNPPRAAAPRPASAAAPRKRTTGRLPPPGPSPRCPADSAIQKPASDHRSYSHVVLTNNLDCILVSDPRSEKVAVSINVPTGYFCDPDDLEGLSQAVQSSLLCGNSAFVGFLHFLSENKGSIRAITFGERTSYCVDGSIASFQELLTRFARFFKDPSFCEISRETALESGTYSEVKLTVVDKLQRQLSWKGHPYQKFRSDKWLSVERDGDIIEDLHNFHHSYYSANLMTLVIYGAEDLDILESVAESTFSCIKNLELNSNPFSWNLPAHETVQILAKARSVDGSNVL